jgi:hypothetical protein
MQHREQARCTPVSFLSCQYAIPERRSLVPTRCTAGQSEALETPRCRAGSRHHRQAASAHESARFTLEECQRLLRGDSMPSSKGLYGIGTRTSGSVGTQHW